MSKMVPIGCDVRVQVVIIDGRYLRWRCTHNHCPAVVKAKASGLQAFHVHDTVTGDQRTEYVAPPKRDGDTEAA